MARLSTAFQDIVSGARRGFWAALVRALLYFPMWPYRVAVEVRNRLYDWKLKAAHCIDCAVISVGNLTTGGTGKTPLVEYLARYLLSRTKKVVIISRGYGGAPGVPSDEEMLLCRNLPDVPHVAGGDRIVCGRIACERHDAEVVLMDDGFQHRRLARDLDIVAVDATNPFGYGHVLPRGLLREPPEALSRADVLVITRSALVSAGGLAELERELQKLAPDALMVYAEERVLAVTDLAGVEYPADALAGKRALAFCGLGNPESFRRTVADLGVEIAAFMTFPDHHRYTEADLRAIRDAAADERAEVILTTQKDRVKLADGFDWRCDVRVVRIGMHITTGEDALKERIDEVVG